MAQSILSPQQRHVLALLDKGFRIFNVADKHVAVYTPKGNPVTGVGVFARTVHALINLKVLELRDGEYVFSGHLPVKVVPEGLSQRKLELEELKRKSKEIVELSDAKTRANSPEELLRNASEIIQRAESKKVKWELPPEKQRRIVPDSQTCLRRSTLTKVVSLPDATLKIERNPTRRSEFSNHTYRVTLLNGLWPGKERILTVCDNRSADDVVWHNGGKVEVEGNIANVIVFTT